MVTPRQKLRIVNHVCHQIKHLCGAVPDEDGLVNGFHGQCDVYSLNYRQYFRFHFRSHISNGQISLTRIATDQA
jgi:hypothetical protein